MVREVHRLAVEQAPLLAEDGPGQGLAQLHPPLVEAVDPPHHPLDEDRVLVQGHQHTERTRRQAVEEDGGAGAVAVEDPVRHQRRSRLVADALGAQLRSHLVRAPAAHQGLGLGKAVGEQLVMVVVDRVGGVDDPDEVARHQLGALVDELEEGVLAVGAGLAPHHRSGGVTDPAALPVAGLAVGLHVGLLQVGRQPPQVLIVGQHGPRRGAEKVPVPHAEHPHQHRDVPLQRRLEEVAVDLVRAPEQLEEALEAHRQRDREADRRPARVAAPDPVPELEDIGGVDAELGHGLAVGGQGHEVARHRPLVAEAVEDPPAGGAGVGHGLLGGEGLRGDDEQGPRRVETARRFDEVGGVDVGDETHVGPVVVRPEGLADHRRAEVGAADAEVDHGRDRLPGEPGPAALTYRLRKRPHLLEHGSDIRHHVFALEPDRAAAAVAEGDVEDRPALGPVELLAAEHRPPGLRHPACAGELEEQPHRRVVDAVLRVVEEQAVELDREAPEAPRIGVELVAHADARDLALMLGQGPPGPGLGQRRAGPHRAVDLAVEEHAHLPGLDEDSGSKRQF